MVRVGVGGRAGSGRGTVIRALRNAGLTVVARDASADFDVYVHVFVETVNRDDLALLRSAAHPAVAVLNKADLTGFGGDGPMATAARRCRELERAHAVPVRPLSALLAVAGTDPVVLDTELMEVLRAVARAAEVPAALRHRLAAELDLFGTACAVAAVRSGAGRGDTAHLLRSVSGVAEVCMAIERAAATVRYARLGEGPAVDDEAVVARMAAAAAVLVAAGAPDPRCITRADQLRRAVHWERYARGPLSDLHRACARDVARGALRLWARADGDAVR